MITCEIHYDFKNKEGEEVCGDSINVKKSDRRVVVSISDGLGSGIKASILSTLTTSMATTMLFNDLPIEEVFKAILSTLPVCKVRGISYANLCSVVCDFEKRRCWTVEYEFPLLLLFKDGRDVSIGKKRLVVEGREIFVGEFEIEENTFLFAATDGLPQAGMGTDLFPFGFGVENTKREIAELLRHRVKPADIVRHLVRFAKKLDEGIRGDDALVLCMSFRPKRITNLFVGPPEDRNRDEEMVWKFLSLPGKKIVCGGTTGKIFERITGKTVEIDMSTMDEYSPPIGYMEGVDLVTEGIVTLTQVFRFLEGQTEKVGFGARYIVEALLDADEVNFFVGRSINPAHQNPLFSHDISLKFRIVRDIARILEGYGKIVRVEFC